MTDSIRPIPADGMSLHIRRPDSIYATAEEALQSIGIALPTPTIAELTPEQGQALVTQLSPIYKQETPRAVATRNHLESINNQRLKQLLRTVQDSDGVWDPKTWDDKLAEFGSYLKTRSVDVLTKVISNKYVLIGIAVLVVGTIIGLTIWGGVDWSHFYGELSNIYTVLMKLWEDPSVRLAILACAWPAALAIYLQELSAVLPIT